MEVRTFEDEDLEAVVSLLAAALEHDRPPPAYVRYLLRDDPAFDPSLVFVALDDGRAVGVVAGVPPDDPRQAPGGIKLFAVAPAHRRRGIASRLFDHAEAALRSRGVTRCVAVNCGNNRLSLGLDVQYTAALCLLWQRGYERAGTTQDMVVDLHGPGAPDLDTTADETRLLAQGIGFRRPMPGDWRWLLEGVEREMASTTPSRRWAYLAGQAFRRDPPTIEVAEERPTGAFLGFAAYDAGRWGALGPMGVAERVRRRGVGAVLLKRCLRDLRADGYLAGGIFAVGPIPFYAKTIGARISRVFYQYAKPL